MDKVIFLDRDGVINVDLMRYVEHPGEFEFEEGAVEAMKKLHEAGYKMIIISNQAGVGDGIFTEEACWEVHWHMVDLLQKEGVEIFDAHYCFCKKTDADCYCRKPNPGMLEEAAKKVSFDKSQTYFVGDKASDIEAGKRFGVKTYFVRTGHGVKDEAKLTGDLVPDGRAQNLLEAVEAILTGRRPAGTG